MFGESDSESPRLPSPWEALSSPSPSPAARNSPFSEATIEGELKKRLVESRPRLVPEVEEGNVEYKLKLINPTVRVILFFLNILILNVLYFT
jgi:hypothetical protein